MSELTRQQRRAKERAQVKLDNRSPKHRAVTYYIGDVKTQARIIKSQLGYLEQINPAGFEKALEDAYFQLAKRVEKHFGIPVMYVPSKP